MRLGRKASGKNGKPLITAGFRLEASRADDVCPRLGMLGDRLTSYAYPHPGNACNAVDPACPVHLEHQVSACLSGKYQTCSLYHFHRRGQSTACPAQRLPTGVLNQALVLERSRSLRQRPFLAILVTVLVAGLLYTFYNVWMPSMVVDLPGAGREAPVGAPTRSATSPLLSPQTGTSLTPSPLPSATPLDIVGLLETPPGSTPGPATASPTRTPLPTAAPAGCIPRTGWQVYTVQPGDTLYRLSQVLGIRVDDIRQANCLGPGDIITAGQQLYLPGQPSLPPARPTRTSPPPTQLPTQAPSPTPRPTDTPPSANTPPPPPTDTPPPPPPTSTSSPPAPRDTPTLAPTESGA